MKYFVLIILIYTFISKQVDNNNNNDVIQEEKINLLIDDYLDYIINYNDTIKLQIQEKIFLEYPILPFTILIIGCFITLYGAYYNFFLIIKITLFLYYLITIFFSYDVKYINRNLLFVLLFSFISAVLIFIIYKSQMKLITKYLIIKKICYGAMTGCFLNQIIFHFILEFNTDFTNYNLYYILFPIFILIFAILNIFIPEKIAFIPCAIISGFFFIQLSIDNLYIPFDLSTTDKVFDIIYFIIIIVLGFLYQIYHLNRKQNEKPISIDTISYKKNMDISMQNTSHQYVNESIEMVEKDGKNLDVTEEVDNHIDDQDD